MSYQLAKLDLNSAPHEFKACVFSFLLCCHLRLFVCLVQFFKIITSLPWAVFRSLLQAQVKPFFNHMEHEKYLMNYKVKYAAKQCHHRGCEYV